jgi:CHAT domain-containing protein/Tfp pilus assembly protein PilF
MKTYLLFFLSVLCTSLTLAQTQVDTLLANRYYHIGDSLNNRGEYQLSSGSYRRAQKIYLEAEIWEKYVACVNSIADNLWRVSAYDSAATQAERAIVLSKQHLNPEHPEVARAYDVLGITREHAGQFDEAIDYYQQALTIRNSGAATDQSSIADSYINLGIAHQEIGAHDQSLEYYYQALAIRESIYPSIHSSIAGVHSNIGWVYFLKGSYQQAISSYQQALKINNLFFGMDHHQTAAIYTNLAQVFSERGAYREALNYHKRALAITTATFGEHNYTTAINYLNIGNTYDYMAEYQLAITYYDKFLTVFKTLFGEDHPHVGGGYSNLGMIYGKTGDYDSALVYLNRALTAYKKFLGDEHPYITQTYTIIGQVYEGKGEYKQSVTYYHKALNLSKKVYGNKSRYVAKVLNLLAANEHQQGNTQSALNFYQQSIAANVSSFNYQSVYENPLLTNYVDAIELMRALQGKATVLESTNDSVAYATYQVADSIAQEVRRSYRKREDKITFSELSRQVYEGAIRTSLRLHRSTNNNTHYQSAFSFAEKSKAGVLIEALSGWEAKLFGSVPDTLLSTEASLRTKRSQYQSQLQGVSLTREVQDSIQGQLFFLNLRYDSLISQLETQYPDYYQLKYASRTVTVPEVQAKLTDNSALLSYFVGDSSNYVFAVTADQYHVISLPIDTLLYQHIEGMRSLLLPQALDSLNHLAFYTKHASALYQSLLAPVIRDSLLVGIEHLTIIPDAELGYLPFELLLTQSASSYKSYQTLPYLIRDYSVSYAYSATWLVHPFSRKSNTEKQYVAFAPSYAPAIADSNELEFLMLGQFRDQIAPLEWNQQEAKDIAQHFSGVSFTGQQASERRFKEEANKYRILHLAMHALIDDNNPMNSRLAFARDATDSLEDGYLNAYELYNMELSADLAVLSACETGFGSLKKGEGIMSLARAFAYAGCPSLVMSHWKVDDRSSSQLMNAFYGYLSQGLSKNEALRQAKLTFLKDADEQTAHPFYWGSFAVVGNIDPILEESNWRWWAIGSVLMIVIIGFLGYQFSKKT